MNQTITVRLSILSVALFMLSACGPPIGVTRVTQEESYRQATRTALSDGDIGNETLTVLRRHNLDELYKSDPVTALRQLNGIALRDGRRDILFALAEATHAWAKTLGDTASTPGQINRPDAYLQSAIYAYLYLLGPGSEPVPSPYDSRFRDACELYNRSLNQAFRSHDGDPLKFAAARRPLLQSTVPVRLAPSQLSHLRGVLEGFYAADDYEVFGFTTRNRTPGLGMPVIAVTHKTQQTPNGGAIPITAFLRIEGGLADLAAGRGQAMLELYSSYDDHSVMVNGQNVPLQTDLSAPLAYRLNDASLWNAGLWDFLGGHDAKRNMLFVQPYERGRIPVVLVHGTGSSPVWWAEMVNTLRHDPVIRQRYQFWFYEYSSNLPVPSSGAFLRETLTEMVNRLDPKHSDPALGQMVVIGHSQGGLLTHLTAIDPGEQLWRSVSDKPFESIETDPEIKMGLRRGLFFKPLPFVKRVVFISTPHRGSFLTKDWVRALARDVLTLPVSLVTKSSEKFKQLYSQLKVPGSLLDQAPTSVDGMSADSPVMKTVARLPLASGITGHSIIAVLPGQDIKTGNDGVVEYSSAHLNGVESERVVRSGHSTQGHPETIEEVRRILLQHLQKQPPE
jgi:pimeloyl-ACP methyl ester carboxylesterase